MKLNVKSPIVALGSAILVVTGCVANAPAGGSTIAVTSTETACDVGANTATSGTVVFDVANRGEQVTEFYLLARRRAAHHRRGREHRAGRVANADHDGPARRATSPCASRA